MSMGTTSTRYRKLVYLFSGKCKLEIYDQVIYFILIVFHPTQNGDNCLELLEKILVQTIS